MSPTAGLDIEVGEIGKLLRPVSDRDIERDAARGQAILVQFADGAEIGGPEEGDPIVLAPVERARFGLPGRGGPAKPAPSAACARGEIRRACRNRTDRR